jgi:GT2 family glycosyltransferase
VRDPAPDRILFAPRVLPPLRPDAAHDEERYRAWAADRDHSRLEGLAGGSPALPVVVFMAVDAPEPALLERTLASLAAQSVVGWTLSVAVVGATDLSGSGAVDTAVTRALDTLGDAGRRVDVAEGTPAADALAAALSALPPNLAPGDGAVMVVWPEDELEPDAVERLAALLAATGAPLVYADSDHVDAVGTRHTPVLVGDWSPDLSLSAPYLGRAVMIRHDALAAAGGFVALPEGCAEHDLVLRLTDGASEVPHLAEVLYHRRAAAGTGPWPAASGSAAVERAVERRRQAAAIRPGPLAGTFRVVRPAPPGHRVSVIVPFRDGAPLLRTCVDTVTATAGALDIEVVLVDNGTTDPETLTLLERLAQRPGVVVRHDGRPFNWAQLNNDAVGSASGDVFLFLNNDIECRRVGWLEALLAQAVLDDVAAVGARLLYPDGRLQHGGVVVGLGGAAGHVLTGLAPDQPGYIGLATLTRDVTAVTGACLATRRSVFESLHGFDESLGLDLNDIDYCLRGRAAGRRIVYEPLAELIHHESPSRGTSGSVPDIERFIDRWESLITAGDPHLNSHLTRVDSSCALRGPDETTWWRDWRSSLRRS